MKFLFVLFVSLFFTGCATLCPESKQAVLQDQQDFCLAFEEFQESHRIDNFQKLKKNYPDSVWAARAETIILYSQELDQRKTQIEKLQEAEQQQTLKFDQQNKLNQELRDKLKEQNELNHQLAEQIEQLKSLLIQSEKHPK
ncbi:MAG: hypothetical protein U9Q61_01785 [Thermodesulfobacteriota bacterium]|nr:hypothetical protein [Thermodesulfobacteriota bacterium]